MNGHLRLRGRLGKFQREEPRGAFEVTLPQGMSGIGFERGMQLRAISLRVCSQRATASADCSCRFRRVSSVRMPRIARKRSSGLAVCPRSRDRSAQPRLTIPCS